jgi:hypothetical protein
MTSPCSVNVAFSSLSFGSAVRTYAMKYATSAMLVVEIFASPEPLTVILPPARSKPKYGMYSIHGPVYTVTTGRPSLTACACPASLRRLMGSVRPGFVSPNSAGTSSFTPAPCAASMSLDWRERPAAPIVEMTTSTPCRPETAAADETS